MSTIAELQRHPHHKYLDHREEVFKKTDATKPVQERASERSSLDRFHAEVLSWSEFEELLRLHEGAKQRIFVIASSSARKAFLFYATLMGIEDRLIAEAGGLDGLDVNIRKRIHNGDGTLDCPVYLGEIVVGICSQSVYAIPAYGEGSENVDYIGQAEAKARSSLELKSHGVPISEESQARFSRVVKKVLAIDSVQCVEQRVTGASGEVQATHAHLGKPAKESDFSQNELSAAKTYIEKYYVSNNGEVVIHHHNGIVVLKKDEHGEWRTEIFDSVMYATVPSGVLVNELAGNFDPYAAGGAVFQRIIRGIGFEEFCRIYGMPAMIVQFLLELSEVPEEHAEPVDLSRQNGVSSAQVVFPAVLQQEQALV